MDEVALIRDTVSHCAPVLIAQNSSRRRPWAGPLGSHDTKLILCDDGQISFSSDDDFVCSDARAVNNCCRHLVQIARGDAGAFEELRRTTNAVTPHEPADLLRTSPRGLKQKKSAQACSLRAMN